MAIYQFALTVIPRKGILEYLGKIPKKIEVDYEIRTDEFLNDTDSLDTLELIRKKSWELGKINSKDIIHELDQQLDRASWGNENHRNTWKTKNENVDNDAFVLTAKENSEIKEFAFRADLRQENLRFLIDMIKLSNSKNLLLIDVVGNIVEPIIEDVMNILKRRNSYKFVENPMKFLTDLQDGKIEIE